MSTLDGDHELLSRIAIFEWLKHKNKLDEIGNAPEATYLRQGADAFPTVKQKIDSGAAIFKNECATCHASNFGTNSDETIVPFSKVGTYFSPTIWNRRVGGIRTAILRDEFWVQGRGMLHDGHIRSDDPDHLDSAEMLLSKDRCDSSSALYKRLYTISTSSFRVPKGTTAQEVATRQQAYFVDFPSSGSASGTSDASSFLYWDYQQMLRSFGPREFGGPAMPLPAMPHPWCVKDNTELDDLLHFLFTL
jgi:hypothetical protein